MARHAGFGAVASITEDLVNEVISSYVKKSGPYYFPPPLLYTVGTKTVAINAVVEMFPPKVELHANQNDLITVHFSFKSIIIAQVSDLPPPKKWTVQLSGTVNVGLVSVVQNNQIVLGIDTSKVQFQPFVIKVLKGPTLPAPILSALKSSTIASTATSYVHSLPPIVMSPPVFMNHMHYTHIAPPPKSYGGPLWSIDLSVTKIVIKPKEKAITVAIDLKADQQFGALAIPSTAGDVNALINLTKVPGSGSSYVYRPIGEESLLNTGLILSAEAERNSGNIIGALNMNFISQVMSQISGQIFAIDGVYVDNDVNLRSVDLGYAIFLTNWNQVQDGIQVGFHVRVETGPWFGVDGRFIIQAYTYGQGPDITYEDEDGMTYTIPGAPPDGIWRIGIAKVEIDEPLWVDFMISIGAISFSIAIPYIAPFIGMVAADLIFSVIPGMIKDAEATAINATGGADVFDFGYLDYLSFTQESIDFGLWYSPEEIEKSPPGTIVLPDSWPVDNKSAIPTSLILGDVMKKFANIMQLTWKVQRADTKAVVLTASKAYNDPGGNGVLIPHHTPGLYLVDSFIVRCTASIKLSLDGFFYQMGEIWTIKKTITMTDNLDRHHSYVMWRHTVNFSNWGTNHEHWVHKRRSRIHRTAISARCRVVKRFALKLLPQFKPNDPENYVTYTDELPFGWDDLNNNRRPLCEYCFFGGPDKLIPFPKEDSF